MLADRMYLSLVHLLEARASELGDRHVFHFATDGEPDGPLEQLSLTALASSARAIAALLLEAGARERPVLILVPPGLEFVRAFFGCLYAGAIAVPAFPPEPGRLERGMARLCRMAESCHAAHALTTSGFASLLQPLLPGVSVLSADEASASPGLAPVPGDVAMLQYTSGSTTSPRGVVLGHEQLLVNSRQIQRAFGISSNMRLVSWLPPYHDMGLIGGVLQPIFLGAEVFGLSPLHFLQRPARWLEAISRFRANASGGPNFSYDLVRTRITAQEKASLDLSSWEVAFNGAEPIRADTLRRFAAEFASSGLRATALTPCYGLAEATLLLCAAPSSKRPNVYLADAGALEGGDVRPAREGTQAKPLVSSGVVAPDVQLAVVDPQARTIVTDGKVGELWVRGPNVARGYREAPEETRRVFDQDLEGSAGWLRTGDLGTVIEGELFVTGRSKDLLIVRGRNVYPQDVEATVLAAHAGIRAGNAVAFSTADEGVGIVLEVKLGAQDHPAILDAVYRSVLAQHDLAPELVVLTAPGGIIKTSSGKLSRAATREALRAGTLPVLASRARGGGATRALYSDLASAFRRLDTRSTRYQFDLERDIPWERMSAPGDFYPEALLVSFGYDVGALQSVEGAWSLFQWRTALSITAGFEHLEEALIGFIARETRHFRDVRSAAVLCEEERKHIALFQRLGASLAAERPALSPDAVRGTQALREALDSFAQGDSFPSIAAYHYSWWLLILFFEELTVWLGDALSTAEGIQPTWLAAHRAHAREETQHVLTDFAFLLALDATEEERSSWSELVFERIVPHLALIMSPDAALRLTLEHFPTVPGKGRTGPSSSERESPFVRLLAQGAFSRTCAAGPHFARIARAAGRARGLPMEREAPELEAFVCDFAARTLGSPVDPSDDLLAAGLDSVGALSLSGALEQKLGARLPASCVYDYPTPSLLARFARARASSTLFAPAVESPPLLARQRRLLALDHAHPGQALDHLVAVFTMPLADAEAVPHKLQRLRQRHPSLWCRYRADERGAFVAELLPEEGPLPLVCEARAFDDAALARRAAELDAAPFDLEKGPPFRAELWRGESGAALLVVIHHMAADGWSLEIVFRELASESPELPAPPFPHAALERERATLASAEGEARLEFWRRELQEHPDCDRAPRPLRQQVLAVAGELTPREWEAVQRRAHHYAATPYIVLLTAFYLAWQRRQVESALIGAHVFNRASEDERRAVGYHVNVLTLRAEIETTTTFGAALERVRSAWLQALDHALPIDHLVRSLFAQRYLDRWLPARVAFNMLLSRGEEEGRWRWRHELAPTPRFLFFDGMFVVLPHRDGLHFTFWYDRDAIGATAAELLVADFTATLRELTVPREPSPAAEVEP